MHLNHTSAILLIGKVLIDDLLVVFTQSLLNRIDSECHSNWMLSIILL